MSGFESENYLQGLKLLAGDAYFKGLAEALPHTMLVIDPISHNIQYINHLQPGFTLEAVIGRAVYDFVWPEYHELYRSTIEKVKLSQKTEIIESEGISTDGKAWYRTHISVLPSTQQMMGSVMLIAENITDKKIKEIELINKREKLNAIINNTSDIICSIDLNNQLTEFNTTFADNVKRGFGVELQIGDDVLRFIDPLRHNELKNIYGKVRSGDTYTHHESFNTPSGVTVYFETNYHPIRDAQNNIIGISIFSKNVTERIKAEENIRTALKEKDVLLSEIHHRIKNNLAMVSSLLQLQELNINSNEAKEALSNSRKRIKSTALVHELLYRKESFENINLNDYITELFEHLKINDNIMLSLHGNTVTVNLSTAMPLGLMLNEIMMNSFKHSYKDATQGKTEIRINSKNNSLQIEYCDCKGLFPEQVDFKNATSTGLTLIKTFAEQLNGKIDLMQKSPPKYVISIPLNG